ncbi:keratinocyte-associated protein 3 [Acipenser oxyrinchus oxyrinchus]|uniref:Keratinocyte-associated protein 3 n=1 Tax=Acipenser oxyrinchus oxyrinchus TaxID=40147 RepID=A0AAD8GBI6_ACIOX|nr:keratinocyte-associated protein 3 [Acipenser oxyrinchus oxyrinchus]
MMCGFDRQKGPRQLMRKGITLIFVGHINFILGAIVHGSVLRHVSKPSDQLTTAYSAANIISVVSGLLSITTGITAILVSRNLPNGKLHVSLLIMSCLNAFLSMACCVGLLLAISLTIMDRGRNLIIGCNSTVLPADGRASTHNCPFDTTRIYDTTLALWFPSMLMAALEAIISVRFFVVGMILRGIGPCGQTYFRERLEEEEAAAAREAGHVYDMFCTLEPSEEIRPLI